MLLQNKIFLLINQFPQLFTKITNALQSKTLIYLSATTHTKNSLTKRNPINNTINFDLILEK